LGEAWDPGVLEYYKKTHDFGKSDDKASLSRGIGISTGGYREWDSSVIEQVQAVAASELARLGMGTTPDSDMATLVARRA
jgi:hypothetical protein